MDTQFLLKFPYLSQECHFTVDSFNKDPHEVHILHLVMSYVFFLLYQSPLFSRPLVPHFVYLLKAEEEWQGGSVEKRVCIVL